ncbi:hypothetical protein [Krasilnikovia sp. M28-CT-15]|uniref:hypothetical protein n=1 Tax=Krasilnikovia sp. M28-CT-15 TaxID=3373540 RepID=UPI003876F9F7
MRMTKRVAAAIATSAASVAMLLGATAVPAQAATTVQGCRAGYVCIYPKNSWNGGHPFYQFLTYGAHNISNQYGMHRIFNNQTGGAKVYVCAGRNGTKCYTPGQPAFTYMDINLTPINSVKLASK